MLLFGNMLWLHIFWKKLGENHLLKLKVEIERFPCRKKEWDQCVVIHPALQRSLVLVQSVPIQS